MDYNKPLRGRWWWWWWIHHYPFAYPSSHAPIPPPNHPCSHASIHPITHPFINASIHPITHPFINLSMHACINSSTYPSMHACINSSIHPSIHLFMEESRKQDLTEPIPSGEETVNMSLAFHHFSLHLHFERFQWSIAQCMELKADELDVDWALFLGTNIFCLKNSLFLWFRM